MKRRLHPRERIVMSLAGLSLVSISLYGIGAIVNRSFEFSYLPTNLLLAWLPLLLSIALVRSLRRHVWSSRLPFALSLLWLLLLPNSFYMISDYVHLQEVGRHNLLYDVLMFTAFVFTALLAGISSLYLVHAELRKRVGLRQSCGPVAAILFLCSFAVYLGRDLRWNSWDVVFNPAGILFDISDHLIHPLQNLAMFTTTATFFVLLGSLYVVGWQLGEAIHQEPHTQSDTM